MSNPTPSPGSSTSTTLAPLAIPEVNPDLRRARNRLRPPRTGVPFTNPAALVPLFYAAVLFLAGIVATRFAYFRPSWLFIGLALLGLAAVAAILSAPRMVWLPVATIWLVLGAWAGETEREPAANPRLAQLADGLLRTVEGAVADVGPIHGRLLGTEYADSESNSGRDESLPDSSELAERMQRVDLQIDRAEVASDDEDAMVAFPPAENARIRLTIQWPRLPGTGPADARAREFNCGERIRAVVRILPADTFHDSGVWSRAAYLESQQVTAIASVNAAKTDGSEPRLALIGAAGSLNLTCLLNGWRDSAADRLQALPWLTRRLPKPLRASPEDAAMLTALLTGDRTYLTRSLRAGFERTGSFHLIVVSGLQLAILAGCVFALARRLRLGRLWATAITLAVALAYALFTGFGIPAQRSFWMVALYLIGRLLYRDRSPLNAIGFATIVLAAVSPRSIFDASLQMTLLAVAAIAGVAAPLLERTLHARLRATEELRLITLDAKLPPRIAQFRVTLRLICHHFEDLLWAWFAWQAFPLAVRCLFRLGELIFVTLVVELALALPMAMYFHRITEYALPVNLCILPLLTVFVPSAMLLLLALILWPAIAIVPAFVTLAILHVCIFIVHGLSALSFGDLRAPDPAHFQIAAAFLLFVLALQLARGSRWQRGSAFAALVLMTVAALWPRPVDHPRDALLVEAIDVGQGDSLLLIAPDGKTLLVDAGGLGFFGRDDHPSSDFDVGEEVVSAALWSRGIRRLDAVALTHAHHDHMGGLAAILRNFRPRELWVGKNPPVPAYLDLLREARELGVRVRSLEVGDSAQLGAAELHVLAPERGYHPGTQPANNDSLVMRAQFGQTSVLLAGDAEGPEEEAILKRISNGTEDLHSLLLKVGHHGSLTSTHTDFLAAVAPRWAVISCGRRNRFGHPRMEILRELQAAGTRTFRTDTEGAVCFRLERGSVSIEPLCSEP